MATKDELEAALVKAETKIAKMQRHIDALEAQLQEVAPTAVDHGPVFGGNAVPLEAR